MSEKALVEDTPEAWEHGVLGCDEKTAKVASADVKGKINEVLGLQSISIRLHKDLIENFKLIAKINGIGYQPLMRDALTRFADSEIKLLLTKLANEKKKQEEKRVETEPCEPEHKRAA